MDKNKIIKLIKEELEELNRTPYFNSEVSNEKIATIVLARQYAFDILENVLNRIEEKKEIKENESEYAM